MPNIEAIVFDVGRVLVDFSLERFGQFLQTKGATLIDTPDFIAKTRMHDYECGKQSSEQFLDAVNDLLDVPVTKEEITEQWKKIFHPVPEMIELLEKTVLNYKAYLLSNTNELHWDFLESEYQLESKSNGAVTSFRAGVMKPDEKIYSCAEELFSLEPSKTVFIDDIQDHVAGAQARGWHGIHHISYEQTLSSLRELGVES